MGDSRNNDILITIAVDIKITVNITIAVDITIAVESTMSYSYYDYNSNDNWVIVGLL